MWKFVLSAAMFVALSVAPAFAVEIGVFNAQAALSKCDAAAVAQKVIQDKFGARGSALEKQQQELQKQGQSFQAQAAAMSQKAREEKQIELMRKGREIEEKRRALMMEVEKANAEMSQAILKIANEATKNVAKKKKLDLILNESSGAVAFAADSMRVDKEVLGEINKLWKAQGGKFTEKKKSK